MRAFPPLHYYSFKSHLSSYTLEYIMEGFLSYLEDFRAPPITPLTPSPTPAFLCRLCVCRCCDYTQIQEFFQDFTRLL